VEKEIEKTKKRPKKEDDGLSGGDSEPKEGSGEDKGKGLKKTADDIKKELEKTREKVRQRDAQVEADDTQVKEQQPQKSGQ
jgi:hypothetical protein